MGNKSGIEWTDATWNPITGCIKVSPGCKNCYAESMSKRLHSMGVKRYTNAFKPTLHPEALKEPAKWKKPRKIFVCSMSDLFQDDVPDEFIEKIMGIIGYESQHEYQILTKRPGRMRQFFAKRSYSTDEFENMLIGTSVENQIYIERVDNLLRIEAARKFLSIEPLLGPVTLGDRVYALDWVIVGGESGPNARPMNPDWVRNLRDECTEIGLPFFFKQWGGRNKKKAGRVLDGRTWDEMPEVLV